MSNLVGNEGLLPKTDGLAAKSMQMAQRPPITAPVVAPSSQNMPVKSQKIVHPDGTQVTHTFDTGSKGQKTDGKQTGQNTAQPQHQIRFLNGQHHVPFRSADGTIKYTNAKGEISQ